VLALLGAGLSACSAAVDVDEAEAHFSETSQAIVYNPDWLWGKSTLSVCWGNSALHNSTEKAWVRSVVEHSIEHLVSVDFIGWGTCNGNGADVRIEVSDNYWPEAAVGTGAGFSTGEDMHLNFFEGSPPFVMGPGLAPCYAGSAEGNLPSTGVTGKHWATNRQRCIETIAVHEFLHTLGLRHEHDSPLMNHATCESLAPRPGDVTYGYWDFVSATNYCNPVHQGETILSPLDVSGLGSFFGLPYNDQMWYGIGNVRDYAPSQHVGDGFLFDMRNYDISGNYSPKVGDFNGDGRSDILWYLPGNGQDMVYFGNTAGNGFDIRYVTQNVSTQVAVADFNGDGRDDILWHVASSGQNTIWRGQSNKLFTQTSAPFTPGNYGHKPYAGDFDGDGRGDIFWDSQGALSDQIWYGTSGGFDQRNVVAPNGTLPVVGDFDGDGKSDIYFYKAGTAPDSLAFGTTTRTVFSYQSLPQNDSATPTVADLDGNGTSDILWSYPGETENIWLFPTLRGTPTNVPTSSVLASDKGDAIPLGGDYDGDGIGDIFWFAR
jgi:hypothetical protein